MKAISKPKTKKCQVCGKEFPKSREKVCSKECFFALIKFKMANEGEQ